MTNHNWMASDMLYYKKKIIPNYVWLHVDPARWVKHKIDMLLLNWNALQSNMPSQNVDFIFWDYPTLKLGKLGTWKATPNCWRSFLSSPFFSSYWGTHSWNNICCVKRQASSMQSTPRMSNLTYLPWLQRSTYTNNKWFLFKITRPICRELQKIRGQIVHLQIQWHRVCAARQQTNHSPTWCNSIFAKKKKPTLRPRRHRENSQIN